jgi:hypothetical protein
MPQQVSRQRTRWPAVKRLTESLGVQGDHDWYRIELVAGQTYTFAMTGTGIARANVADSYLRLRDGVGGQIAFDDDSGPGLNSLIGFTATTTGTYYLDAGAYGDRYSGQYDLSVTGQTPPVEEPTAPFEPLPATRIVETSDAAAGATTTYSIGIGKTAQGNLSAAGDHDWYGVSLVAGQTYTFAMVGTGIAGVRVSDSFLRLYDGTGALLGSDDDGGPGSNSTISFTATTTGT